jgi:hypothetical protein
VAQLDQLIDLRFQRSQFSIHAPNINLKSQASQPLTVNSECDLAVVAGLLPSSK